MALLLYRLKHAESEAAPRKAQPDTRWIPCLLDTTRQEPTQNSPWTDPWHTELILTEKGKTVARPTKGRSSEAKDVPEETEETKACAECLK